MLAWQPTLLASADPVADGAFAAAERRGLDDESWVELVPGWLNGADALFATLLDDAPWQGHERWMYDRRVVEPRLRAQWGERPPVIDEMAALLTERYGVAFTSTGFNLYRDGRDSVAWHGDRVARDLPTAIVAILTLGGPRRFLLRPKGGGRSIRYEPASGDLLVMGGACQRRWDHCVPKVAVAAPRISVTFRHAYAVSGRSAQEE
jgi:alkylated DNA repair dioxygenase AlkB